LGIYTRIMSFSELIMLLAPGSDFEPARPQNARLLESREGLNRFDAGADNQPDSTVSLQSGIVEPYLAVNPFRFFSTLCSAFCCPLIALLGHKLRVRSGRILCSSIAFSIGMTAALAPARPVTARAGAIASAAGILVPFFSGVFRSIMCPSSWWPFLAHITNCGEC
jgi:hypothetical protein